MSKHIGAYSSLHGPGGKTLTDYTESNIPALWNITPERISNVANTGGEYTGHIFGWPAEHPLEYTENKFFFFSPHVHNLANARLSLNSLPLLPIVEPSTRSPLAAGSLVPGTDYLFWIKRVDGVLAFERLMNLRNPTQGPKGDPGQDGEDGTDGTDGAQGPQGPPGPIGNSITHLLAADSSIPAYTGNADVIGTGGFTTYSDAGGKFFKRGTTTAPSAPSFFRKQAFDGHWYEAISKRNLLGEDLGILTPGVDYSGVINEAITWLNGKGGGKITLPPFSITCDNDLVFNGDGLALCGTSVGNQNSLPGTTVFLANNRTIRVGGNVATGDPDRRMIQFSDFACRQASGSTAYFFTSLGIRNLQFHDLYLSPIFGFHRAGDQTPVALTHPNFTRVVSYQNIEGNLATTSQHFVLGDNFGSFYMAHCVIEGQNPPVNESCAITFPPGASNRPDGAWIDSCGFGRFDKGLNVENGIANLFVSNTWFDGMKKSGVSFEPDAPIQGVRFSNCHFAGHPPMNNDQIGILIAEGAVSGTNSRISFDNCHIIHFGKQGLNIQDPTYNVSIIGNQFEDNCSATNNATDESVILISAAVNDLVIAHNQIYKRLNGSGPAGNFIRKPKYGINILSTQERLSVVHNQIEPNDLASAASGGKTINNPNRGPAHVRRIHSNTHQVFEGQVVTLGPWIAQNVNASAGLTMSLGSITGVINVVSQRRGKAVGISCRANANMTAGNITFNVMKNGSAFGMTATLTAPPSAAECFDEDLDGNDFAAGDQLGVRLTTTAGYLPAGVGGLEWAVYVSIYYD